MRIRRLKLKLSTLLLLIATFSLVCTQIPKGWWPRRPHVPSPDEIRAIKAAVKLYARMYNGNENSILNDKTIEISARRLEEGGWKISICQVSNPEPGGLRTWDYFLVNSSWSAEYLNTVSGGAY
jgi:hypothetical protein